MADQLYSAEEAAQILGLQPRTVRNYVRQGRLPGVRIGKQYRIARADLEAFTAGGRAPEELLPRGGRPQEPTAAVPSFAEVSSVVELNGIESAGRDRLVRTLSAAALAASSSGGATLRVEGLYDAEGQRLKVIIVGPLAGVADLLRILDAFTRGPDSPAVF